MHYSQDCLAAIVATLVQFSSPQIICRIWSGTHLENVDLVELSSQHFRIWLSNHLKTIDLVDGVLTIFAAYGRTPILQILT